MRWRAVDWQNVERLVGELESRVRYSDHAGHGLDRLAIRRRAVEVLALLDGLDADAAAQLAGQGERVRLVDAEVRR